MALQSSGMPFLGADFGGGQPSGQPSLQFSVPCLEVVDEDSKPPSFNYLFYELPLPEFPYQVSFYVANGWCNGKGDFVQKMQILNPDRTPMVQTGNQPFKLTGIETPFMAVNFFQGIQFTKPGTYWFQVFLGDRKVLEYPLSVREAKAGSAPAAG